jgi:hypothetical protein
MYRITTFIFTLLFVLSIDAIAGKKTVQVSASDPDTDIYANGRLIGQGQGEILILSNSCVTVKFEKTGLLREQIEFCNRKSSANPPKTYYQEMVRDDAFDASVSSDIANVDIEMRAAGMEEIDAWKLLSQIVTSYFDVIEVTDRETGYMRTSWVVQTFQQNTIRSRVIVKLSSSDPLAYKLKLVSEESRNASTSVKSDELFREWDRVLRKYGNVITELQSRLGS